MSEQRTISEKSRRVAKNTLLLYFRMLLLMFIGLFTSRVVLQTLGVDDYGTYNAVYSIVMMFTVLSNGISGSIGRFMAYELGKGDRGRLKKVFSSAIVIQMGLCVILFILAETLGLWYFRNRMVIPEGRSDAAMWVFQTSIVYLAIQLMSMPFNCTIVAHEDMKAYAWVSILEGILKMGIALTLYLTSLDRLKVYSVLMVTVALVIRGTYTFFCKRHYEETRGRLQPDKTLARQMLSFGAWSFTAHGVGVFNTQGVNLLSNAYFGVGINAVRGIAGQVENIVRQFLSNFLMALNPLIIKTWAEGNKEYCFALVRKGCKFCFLIVLLFAVPFLFESDFILHIWLGEVPQGAPLFTCLAIICVMMDFMSNSLAQLIVANGRVGKYYTVTSVISSLTFIGTLIAFNCGATPQTTYYISAAVLFIIAVVRLVFARQMCTFPIKPFIVEVIMPLLAVSVISIAATFIPYHFISGKDIVGSLVCIFISLLSVCISAFLIALTKGERHFIVSHLKKKAGV